MGKEKNKKNRKLKGPAGTGQAPSEKAVAATADDDTSGEAEAAASGSLSDMVASPSAENRSAACATYAMLFEGMASRGSEHHGRGASVVKATAKSRRSDKVALGRLLDQGVSAKLCGLLCGDTELRVRTHAAQALRTLLAAVASVDPEQGDAASRTGIADALLTASTEQLDAITACATAAANGNNEATALATLTQHADVLVPTLAALTELLQLSPIALAAFIERRTDAGLAQLLISASSSTGSTGALGGVPAALLLQAAHVLHVALERNPSLAQVLVAAPMSGSGSASSGRDEMAACLTRLVSLADLEARQAVEIGSGSDDVRCTVAHLAGALLNIHLSLAGTSTAEGPAQSAATAQAVLPALLGQLSASHALPVMPALPAPAPAPASADGSGGGGGAAAAVPPAGQGYVPVAAPEDEAARAVWGRAYERLLLSLEVLNDLAAGVVDDDDDDEQEEEGEWGSDDEDAMEAAAGQALALSSSSGTGDAASAKRACLMASLEACAGANAGEALLNLLEELMVVPHSHGLGAASNGQVLLADVCDLRAHACLVAGRLCGASSGAAAAAHLSQWRRLAACAHSGLEEAMRLGTAASDLAGPWLAALAHALLRLLDRAPSLGTSPEAAHPAPPLAAAGGGGGGGGGGPGALLRLMASRGPSADVRCHALRALGVLGARWLTAATSECAPLARDALTALVAGLSDGEATVSSEALDVCMDVFGGDDSAEMHAAYVELGVHGKVNEATKALKAKLKGAERESMGREAVAAAKEVALNAQRFLKYKAKL